MRRLNIRWRLTFWFGAAMTVLLVGRSFWIYFMMEQRLGRIADTELIGKADVLDRVVRKCASVEELSAELARYADSLQDVRIEITDSRQQPFFRSRQPTSAVENHAGQVLSTEPRHWQSNQVSDDGDYRRVVTSVVPSAAGDLTLKVSRSMQAKQSEVWDFAVVLLSTVPLVIVAAFGTGYLVSSRALTPVDKMISTANDITANRLDQRIDVPDTGDELARLAKTLNEMIDRLNTSFEEMRHFTADAAHDLRTPVAALRTEVEVSLMADQTVDEYRHSMQTVLEEAINLSRLTEQLLDLSREDHGLNPPSLDNVRLDAILHGVVEVLSTTAQQKRIEIDTSRVKAWTLTGDQVRLRRVFMNLLNNSIQYTQPGGRVWIEGESSPQTMTIVIADNGPGVPADDLPHIFDRFRRVDQARSSQSGGTGLGLAICKSIVESHGGRIRMESKPGQGTRVIVTLPASRAAR